MMLCPRVIRRPRRCGGKVQLLLAIAALTFVLKWLDQEEQSKDEKETSIADVAPDSSNLNRRSDDTTKKDLAEHDGYDKNAIRERFKYRSLLTKTVCEIKYIKKRKGNLAGLMYIPDKNVLFCPIQKCASTFWQRVLYTFTRKSENDDPFSVKIDTAYKYSKQFKIKTKGETDYLINNSNSFVFVRHPFTRLFSGWLDKFFSAHPIFWNIGSKITRAERGEMSCGHDVTFKEFISYVSKSFLYTGRVIDPHFSPSFIHCNVCNLDYKYIGKYETLKEDTRFIMEEYGLTNNFSLFDNFEDKSKLDMIDDAVDWVFEQENGIRRCISFHCGLFRVWKRLICRGVISKKETFPYKTAEQADSLTKEEFRKYLVASHKRSDPNEVIKNRVEVLAEAFQSLDKETFKLLLDAFKLDFDLFGYSRHETFLDLRISSDPNEQYLQSCPFL